MTISQVFDDTIAEKWKAEALATPGRDVSQKMIDWIIEELRFKASIFQRTSAVSVFDGDVVKSDTAIPTDIRDTLQASVRSLEDVPEIYKDYHPGSDGRVLDLVHPSLFPLIYGKSRVLEDSLIGLDDCIQSCGKGVVVPIRSDDERQLDRKGSIKYSGMRMHQDEAVPYSKAFQVGEAAQLTVLTKLMICSGSQVKSYSIQMAMSSTYVPLENRFVTHIEQIFKLYQQSSPSKTSASISNY